MNAPRNMATAARALLLAAPLLVAAMASAWAQDAQRHFADPEAAADAFKAAVVPVSADAVLDLFGAKYAAALVGGDPANARAEFASVSAAASESITLRPDGGDRYTLVLGRLAWPMPIPLAKDANGWFFDTAAGIEEIVDRHIGRNELAAIAALRAYVDAQVAYASKDRDSDQVLEYAQRLMSTPGRKDGLYWPVAEGSGEEVSPLGPFLAAAQDRLGKRTASEPYYGYFFKVLTKQGKRPPAGRYDYVINGHMIAGFAMVAWPADYGNSGIMTFLVSHQGKVFQKDLGPETAAIAAAMTEYDPNGTWQEVTDGS